MQVSFCFNFSHLFMECTNIQCTFIECTLNIHGFYTFLHFYKRRGEFRRIKPPKINVSFEYAAQGIFMCFYTIHTK